MYHSFVENLLELINYESFAQKNAYLDDRKNKNHLNKAFIVSLLNRMRRIKFPFAVMP